MRLRNEGASFREKNLSPLQGDQAKRGDTDHLQGRTPQAAAGLNSAVCWWHCHTGASPVAGVTVVIGRCDDGWSDKVWRESLESIFPIESTRGFP